ncbi:unnamed protein product [Prorocentrum cordatum]|uniref:Subtilisin n=1 Tax=Prorocentrum cordatum TaxID=2364126 RepID=A0ABN9QQ21_9DINO|nr:unnamed protein product [Polarella glacialis]
MLARWTILALVAARTTATGTAEQPEEPACAVHEEDEADGLAALQTTESKRKATSESHGSSNTTAPGVSSGPTCYGYTGGSCSVQACTAARNAKCSGGYCTCDAGCSSANGTCYMEKNKVIAQSFTLSNAKWPNYYMYMKTVSTFDQMRVSDSWFGVGGDKFSLYQLPGAYEGQPTFFLGSSKWESSVVAIAGTTGTAVHPYAAYAKSLEKKTGVDKLAVAVCARANGTIMIGGLGNSSITKKPVWAYIQHGTWLVYGYSTGDPGQGGYWIPKPAFPANSVPACSV